MLNKFSLNNFDPDFHTQGGRGGVLGISSDGDDRIERKVKTQKKSLGLPEKPKKIPGRKINPQTIPCRFCGP